MSDEEPLYPYPAFSFSVVFAQSSGIPDTSFQEVSGMGQELESEPFTEGGENRFVHQLPTTKKHARLVLKRGLVKVTGGAPAPGQPPKSLAAWCMGVLEDDTVSPVQTYDISVRLLDSGGQPVAVWNIVRAYPVKWEFEPFDAMKNSVAIERVELNYAYATRES